MYIKTSTFTLINIYKNANTTAKPTRVTVLLFSLSDVLTM